MVLVAAIGHMPIISAKHCAIMPSSLVPSSSNSRSSKSTRNPLPIRASNLAATTNRSSNNNHLHVGNGRSSSHPPQQQRLHIAADNNSTSSSALSSQHHHSKTVVARRVTPPPPPAAAAPLLFTPPNHLQRGGGAHAHQQNDHVVEMPAQFITAMRTLFDLMDDKGSGFVRFTDIERRWHDDSAPGLPHGVIDSLRKVTPPNGLLTFDSFCAGLKICLARRNRPPQERRSMNAVSGRYAQHNSNSNNNNSVAEARSIPPVARMSIPPASPSSPQQQARKTTTAPKHIDTTSTAAYPAIPVPFYRTLSLPKLFTTPPPPPLAALDVSSSSKATTTTTATSAAVPLAPPKPPRTALVLGNGVTNINHLDHLDKAEIRHALQNWQRGVLQNEKPAVREKRILASSLNNSNESFVRRGIADGGSTPDSTVSVVARSSTAGNVVVRNGTSARRTGRNEPRRHTLQNGIDYNVLKQIGQLEQEKELLVQGMEAVNATRDWYTHQLGQVQDGIKQLTKTNNTASMVCCII